MSSMYTDNHTHKHVIHVQNMYTNRSYMYTTKYVYKHVIHVQDKHTQAHTSSMNKLKKRSEERNWVVQQLCITKGITGSGDKALGII